MIQSYKRRLREAAQKTKVYLEILEDDRLTEAQIWELADYMQQVSDDRLTKVYKIFKEKQTKTTP
ncbi:MAG: hypothetical protein JNN12_03565 [Bacteroidetes Order II. Incertae sedis bacterium]|nr:hypothetical protein [Bacteroidetes Order II. bacterium]